MMFNPVIIIKKLKVSSAGHVLYEESFHEGVNIIRSSDNSVGKTSIMDLIFYSLGGEVRNWVDELKDVDNISLEVEINGKSWTLKRDFPKWDAPLFIFEGTLIKSEEKGSDWFKYPYKRSKHQSSFSQELFKILGFPEQKTDFDDNITINQALRLMYEDQITPVDRLFKDIDYDKEATRSAVFELLMGIDDLKVHWEKINLKRLEKTLSEFNSEYKAIVESLSVQGLKPEEIRGHINNSKEELEQQLSNLNKSVDLRLRVKESEANSSLEEELKTITSNIDICVNKIKDINKKIETLEVDRYDSDEFIASLQERVKALQDSSSFVKFLGEISLKYCPSCLVPLDLAEDDPNHCGLCKSKIGESGSFENRVRMEQELTFQLKESELLQTSREDCISDYQQKREQLYKSLDEMQRSYSNHLSQANTIDAKLKDDIEKIGYIQREIEGLDEQSSKLEKLDWIIGKINSTDAEIEKSKDAIKELLEDRELYSNAIYEFIESTALSLIKKDLPVEEGFQDPKRVMVDFAKNRVFVDNKSRFSASSEVVLKNCVLLSLFLASVKFDRVRLPRFLLLDNIEDKGMTKDRIQNFQRMIVDISQRTKIKHQIIFTTSSIDESLNIKDLCVGDFYNKDAKVLKLKQE